MIIQIKYGRLTQLAECHLDVVKVTGSSPVSPTKKPGKILNRPGFSFSTALIPKRSSGIKASGNSIPAYLTLQQFFSQFLLQPEQHIFSPFTIRFTNLIIKYNVRPIIIPPIIQLIILPPLLFTPVQEAFPAGKSEMTLPRQFRSGIPQQKASISMNSFPFLLLLMLPHMANKAE